MKRYFSTSLNKSVNERVRSDTLDSINAQFLSGTLQFDQARHHVQQLIRQLKPQQEITYNTENQDILDKYWEAEGKTRDLISSKASYNRLRRAVEAVGKYSLRSAKKEDLQNQINTVASGNKQRDIISALNQLLKWIERKDKLRKGKIEVRTPRYLSKHELEMILLVLPSEQQLVFQVAFGTGCRLGEVFAIREEAIEDNQIVIDSQMLENGTIRHTKTRLVRRTLILPGFQKAIKEWAEWPLEKRFKIRNLAWSKIARKACVKAKLRKVCVFHDLRHSFAIFLKNENINITDIANALGNSVVVCEKYYAGLTATKESLNNVLSKLSR